MSSPKHDCCDFCHEAPATELLKWTIGNAKKVKLTIRVCEECYALNVDHERSREEGGGGMKPKKCENCKIAPGKPRCYRYTEVDDLLRVLAEKDRSCRCPVCADEQLIDVAPHTTLDCPECVTTVPCTRCGAMTAPGPDTNRLPFGPYYCERCLRAMD